MADVARGSLGAFVNNITNLWDVAAGEVLIRACGGEITEFDGSSISYSSPSKMNNVSLIAAKKQLHYKIREIITRSAE